MLTKTLVATAILAPVTFIAIAVALTNFIGRQKMFKTILATAAATVVAASFAAPAHAGIQLNGISLNGIQVNGIQLNGLEAPPASLVIDGIELPAARR